MLDLALESRAVGFVDVIYRENRSFEIYPVAKRTLPSCRVYQNRVLVHCADTSRTEFEANTLGAFEPEEGLLQRLRPLAGAGLGRRAAYCCLTDLRVGFWAHVGVPTRGEALENAAGWM